MKKFIPLFLFCLLFIVSLQTSFAFTFDSKTTLDVNEEVKDDLYISGQTMNVNKDVLGDLLFAGQMLNFNSAAKGDLMGAGQMINISSNISDDLRIAGQKIDISSQIEGDAIIFGQLISTSKESVIKGDAMIYGQALNLMGNIGGKAKLGGETVNIMSEIKGDVEIEADTKVNFSGSGMILGNLKLKAPENIDKKYVKGEIKFEKLNEGHKDKNMDFNGVDKKILGILTAIQIIHFVFGLILGIILILLLKNYILAITEESRKNVFMSICSGFFILIALPILGFLILSTFIGLPISGILFFVYFSLLILASVLCGFVVGNLIIPFDKSTGIWKIIGSYVLGSVVMFVIGFVPFVGWFVNLIIFLFALGAIGRVHWENVKNIGK